MITAEHVASWPKEDVKAENGRQQAAIRQVLEAGGFVVQTVDLDLGRQIGVMWRVREQPPWHKAQRFPLGTEPQEILEVIQNWMAQRVAQ